MKYQSLEKTLAELAGLAHTQSAEASAAQLLADVRAFINSGAGGGLQSVTVDLSTAQIATLGSSPVEYAPSAGPNTVLVPVQVSFQHKAGSQPFGTSIMELYAGWAAGQQYQTMAVAAGEIQFDIASDSFNSGLFAPDGTPVGYEDAPGVIAAGADPGYTGSILTKSVEAGGLLYAPGDTGTITNPLSGTVATYTVDTVVGGAVTGFSINNPGTQYSVANGLTTTPTSGLGDGNFTVNVLTITPLSDGTGRAIILYYVMPLI